MKYGLNIWNFAANPTADIVTYCHRVAALGFNAIELPVYEPSSIDVAAVKSALTETGLELSILAVMAAGRDGSSADEEVRLATLQYLVDSVRVGATLGARVFAGPIYAGSGKRHWLSPPDRQAEWARAIATLRTVAREAEKEGILLAIEPLNRYRTSVVNTAVQALNLVDDVDSPALGVLFDTYQANIEESYPYAALEAVLAEAKLYHFHACENHRGVPGTGHIDWEWYGRLLNQYEYQGHATLETFVAGGFDSGFTQLDVDPDARATAGLQTLKQYFEE